MLKRPEIAKSLHSNNASGLLRYTWYMMRAAHYGGRGDLDNLFQSLVRAFQNLPTTLKTSYIGVYILKNACGVKRMIKNGEKLSDDDKAYLKTKYEGMLLETFIDLLPIQRLKDEERKQYLEDLIEAYKSIKTI